MVYNTLATVRYRLMLVSNYNVNYVAYLVSGTLVGGSVYEAALWRRSVGLGRLEQRLNAVQRERQSTSRKNDFEEGFVGVCTLLVTQCVGMSDG